MSSNKRDDNFVPNISGVSSVTYVGNIEPAVNPTTHAWMVDTSLSAASQYALKETVSGAVSYFARAIPGSSQSDPAWQAFKLDETSGMLITWADGNTAFDNIATDLTALSYS